MPDGLAELTVRACAQAVLDWFDREMAMQPQTRDVVFLAETPWLDFRNFTATRNDGQNHYLPGAWIRLSNDPVADGDGDAVLSPEPFVVEIHTRDPTRVSQYADPEVSVASRPLPWRQLLIFPTERYVLASTYGVVAPNWHTMRWPFPA